MKFKKRNNQQMIHPAIFTFVVMMTALLLCSIILLILNQSPVMIYRNLIIGALGTPFRILQTINQTSLLLLAALGVSMAFKIKFMNIGGEGQIMMGGIFASFIALYLSYLPAPILIPVMLLAGFIGGSFWAMIACVIKLKFKVNETIVTLMLNYIAIQIAVILQQGAWKDPASLGYPKVPNFAPQALLFEINGLHIGWIIALVVFIFVYWLLTYSKLGYEMSVIGQNETTAKYAGMNITKTIIFVMVLSGGISGLVGFIQVSGNLGTMNSQLSANIGFIAIMIAWISKLKPVPTILCATSFAIIQQGALFMESSLNVPSSISLMIQGIILFSVLGSDIFRDYQIQFKRGQKV